MIRRLIALADSPTRRALRRIVVLSVAAAVVQGVAFVLLVPFLTALLSGDKEGMWLWLAVLAAVGLVYGIVGWNLGIQGTNAGALVVASLLRVLGDRLVELPVGWFAKDRTGELTDVASRGAVFTSAAPYAMLRPIIAGFVTPATVLVGALVIDWRIGLTMAACVPVMWLAYRRIERQVGRADREHAAAVGEAAARVIEFARVQPALRAAGDNPLARRLIDSALRGQHSTG
ncbi:MAG: hypothetical protein LBG11_09005, partial [Bifidobacteriaceae bacterium]|nr:hypothetical protein [Bifidobacteriaceae bacterium]